MSWKQMVCYRTYVHVCSAMQSKRALLCSARLLCHWAGSMQHNAFMLNACRLFTAPAASCGLPAKQPKPLSCELPIPLSGESYPPSPLIVNVLPEPVCPYARIVAL